MWAWLGRIKDTWSWGRFAWQLAGALGITGLVSSVGGAVWAMVLGVPLPIALMVGYCTLVGAVYLAMAPLAYRALAQSPANAPNDENKKVVPNYAAWRHLETYEIRHAAKLWCGVDPAQESTLDTNAWTHAFIAAVKKGDLKLDYNSSDRTMQAHEELNPLSDAKITRASLQSFAKTKGYDPIFLRDA
jgi:hypothetical protein